MDSRRVPAVSFLGRSGSGKTTIIEQLITTLTSEGVRVGSIKHHGHPDFDIDVPGKDSWRFTQAGALTSVIVSSDKLALVRKLDQEIGYDEIAPLMGGLDLIIVEGFREEAFPVIRVMREANPKQESDLGSIGSRTIAVVTDMDRARVLAQTEGLPVFDLEDIEGIAEFLTVHILDGGVPR